MPRVLLIGHTRSAGQSISSRLSKAGFDVRASPLSAEAAASAADPSVDLLLIVSDDDPQLPDTVTRFRNLAPHVPIVVLIGSDGLLAARCIRVGANDFVTTAGSMEVLPAIVDRNLRRGLREGAAGAAKRSGPLTSQEASLDALLSALDAREVEPPCHVERVTAFTMVIADQLGIDSDDRYDVERGALLHDIGKLGTPDRILTKADGLTPTEWKEACRHPVTGFRMCSQVDFLKGAAQIVLHHHEQWDGTGYPDGLAGDMIPVGARIFAVADAFEALTASRPGRGALTIAEARREIARAGGSCFDADIVTAFMGVETGRLARIASASTYSPRPTVSQRSERIPHYYR